MSGGPLASTGVMQGMSGSPVYLDGRLAGAVALAFAYSKEAIAGVRPIEEMLRVGEDQGVPARRPVPNAVPPSPGNAAVGAAGPKLAPIATPVSFAGFTESTLTHFGPQLRALGLEPVQGVSSGGHLPPAMGDPSKIQPGSMITVQLLSGDMSIGADGTVTNVDGNRVYAFGHHFLSSGTTELPFARADVITVLPNLSTSFKISSAREWMGAILQDRSAAISGEVGRRASTVPLDISVAGPGNKPLGYHMQMVNDPILAPFILQMAVFSAIEATGRTLGISSFALEGEIQFQSAVPPLKIANVFAGEFNVAQQAGLGAAAPLSYILNSGFADLKVKQISLGVRAYERKRILQIDQITPSRRQVRPGDRISLDVSFTGDNGSEVRKTVEYAVPVGAPPGALQFTVSDAFAVNISEYAESLGVPAHSAGQVIGLLNRLRPNTAAVVRAVRTDTAYSISGQDIASPPPSLALFLARNTGASAASTSARGSAVFETAIDLGDAVASGSRSVSVEVKE